MEKMDGVVPTEKSCVPVAPKACALTVTIPDDVPVMTAVIWPVLSVCPCNGPKYGVMFVILTLPEPEELRVTGVPVTGELPPASFTETYKVLVLPIVIFVGVAVSPTVEPTICMLICADAPPTAAVAVIVALRLVLFFPPEEKVAVPGVVTVAGVTTPVSQPMFTTTPDNEALLAFNALTVIVEIEPSVVLIAVGVAERSIDAALVVISVFVAAAASAKTKK
jgi:hypothetical protein